MSSSLSLVSFLVSFFLPISYPVLLVIPSTSAFSLHDGLTSNGIRGSNTILSSSTATTTALHVRRQQYVKMGGWDGSLTTLTTSPPSDQVPTTAATTTTKTTTEIEDETTILYLKTSTKVRSFLNQYLYDRNYMNIFNPNDSIFDIDDEDGGDNFVNKIQLAIGVLGRQITDVITDAITSTSTSSEVEEPSSSSIVPPLTPEEIVEMYFDTNIKYLDASSFYNTVVGKEELKRHFGLFETYIDDGNDEYYEYDEKEEEGDGKKKGGISAIASKVFDILGIDGGGSMIIVDDIIVSDELKNNNNPDNNDDDEEEEEKKEKYETIESCLNYHRETTNGDIIPNSRGIAFYTLRRQRRTGAMRIINVFDVNEPPSPKPGDAGLALLRAASTVIDLFSSPTAADDSLKEDGGEKEATVELAKMETEMNNSTFTEVLIRTPVPPTIQPPPPISATTNHLTPPEIYYEAFNNQNMEKASQCFTKDCIYDDAQYPQPLLGRDALLKQLNDFAEVLPPSSFNFAVDGIVADDEYDNKYDEVINEIDEVEGIDENVMAVKLLKEGGRRRYGVRWHVEDSSGEQLPFTRGASFYTSDRIIHTNDNDKDNNNNNILLNTALDIPERAVFKTGTIERTARLIQSDPIRLVPLLTFLTYLYVVFLSDGIIPGANALAFEGRTWTEVKDLSLNFFLIAPLLHLPLASEDVHPMLEGMFNLLLAWAGMFAGFLSDERRDKPNILRFGPVVVGMQFLTSAFLLPYLFTRAPEPPKRSRGVDTIVCREAIDGTVQAIVSEWKPLGPTLCGVGSFAILWALGARPEYGDFAGRWESFRDLLSIDRVGSSFVVDLAVFAVFQGWLVDDDLIRRGIDNPSENGGNLRLVAKFVPFFGLAAYLFLRPALPSSFDDDDVDGN